MANVTGTLEIICLPDGSIKMNARGLGGTERDLLAEMEDLAKEVGGQLIVEKHERHRHTHLHPHTHVKQKG